MGHPGLQYNPNISSGPVVSTSSGALPTQPSFRAPAHKHAHHLHSIPPREKSTRTLIIDHMLWVHARTRFAQARAELGMTDRTGGPSSPNYVHRTRPENYEEDDEEGSEGEDIFSLKSRAGDSGGHDVEEDRLGAQDLTFARTLRLRAEGLEKVVTSMLEQPPPVHPINDEDILTPPTSPRLNPSSLPGNKRHPHTLPNGVRLRLALGTIINDLFARQAPTPPYRHQFQQPKSSENSPVPQTPSYAITTLPSALATLSTVCAAHSMAYTHHSSFGHAGYTLQQNQRFQSFPVASPRTHSLYMAGADPRTANSPPAFRCPRHLHTGCEICVEARSGGRQNGASRGRSRSFTDNRANAWKGMPGGMAPGGGGISGWQDGSGIGSGLLRPGVEGSCLRRKTTLDSAEEGSLSPGSSGSGNTKLSELIPRFIKLSALVASELGLEAREEEEEPQSSTSGDPGPFQGSADGNWRSTMPTASEQHRGEFSPLSTPMSPTGRASLQVNDRMRDYALRPTRQWYLLLAGLLTRAVLEGYLTAGWRGSQPVECLLTVGLGLAENAENEKEPESGFEEFDPDDLPTLIEAIKTLFPALRGMNKNQAEEEYELEMLERLRRFFDIPASTPDLSTHMEDLAWQYPAEPVERAAIRFCEAIARWRGKPELETYKIPKQSTHNDHETSNDPSLPMESLVHSNPTSPSSIANRKVKRKPSIDVYFAQRMLRISTGWNPNKRPRSPDDGRPGSFKRVHT